MLGSFAMEVAAMGDGVVIMLVGMGVVFLFLIVLMGGIRLLSVRRRRLPGPATGANPAPRTRSLETSGNGLRAGGDPAVQRAAAVAVALELMRRAADRAGRGADSPTWRDSGRVWHQRGPQAVATVLAGRRGAR